MPDSGQIQETEPASRKRELCFRNYNLQHLQQAFASGVRVLFHPVPFRVHVLMKHTRILDLSMIHALRVQQPNEFPLRIDSRLLLLAVEHTTRRVHEVKNFVVSLGVQDILMDKSNLQGPMNPHQTL